MTGLDAGGLGLGLMMVMVRIDLPGDYGDVTELLSLEMHLGAFLCTRPDSKGRHNYYFWELGAVCY